ncbi:39637_t:CDS:2, partial [Gigaspora margarita]
MNNTINTIEDMNLLSDESDFNTNLLNNKPEIVPVENNESEIGLVENDESEIDLVENDESEIGLVENDFEHNNKNTDEKILKNIKFYTQEGHLGATDQHRLLKASYPHHTLHKKDLYNAIQQFRNENDPNLNNVARLLEYLLDQKHNNIDLYVKYKAETTNSVIKRQLNYRNISIYDLFIELEERLATKNINSTFIDWKISQCLSKSNRNIDSVFKPIDDIIKTFLIPTSLKKQQDQMNLSGQYHATRVLHENQYNNQFAGIFSEMNKSGSEDSEAKRSYQYELLFIKLIHEIDDKCIDDIFDYPQALTSHIYQQFNNLITMVWNIVNVNEPTFPQF